MQIEKYFCIETLLMQCQMLQRTELASANAAEKCGLPSEAVQHRNEFALQRW